MVEQTLRKKPWYRLRNLILGAMALIVVWLGWAFFEVWKVYTGEPKITRDYRAEFRKLSEKAAGVAEGSGDEAWDKFVEATARCSDIIREYEKRIRNGELPARKIPGYDDEYPVVDFGLVRQGASIPDQVAREREVLQLLRNEGIFASLARFAAIGPGFRKGDNSVSMMEELMPELAHARILAQARGASMRISLSEGDHAEVARAVDELLAVSRTLSHQPAMISTLVGIAISTLALAELKTELLESEFDEASCRALLKSFDRHPIADVALILRGEQAAFHDFVQRFFSDNERGNGYIDAKSVQVLSGSALMPGDRSFWSAAVGRFLIPSRAQTIAHFDEFVELCQKELQLAPSKRWQGSFDSDRFVDALGRRDMIVKLMIPPVDKCFDSIATGEQNYEATRVMVALELFHTLHQRWPATLDELAPEILPKPPRDPLHGGAFGYRLLENDPHGRPYVLYSFGIDEQDDGGKMTTPLLKSGFEYSSDDYKALSDRNFSGFDFVFNVPRHPSQFEATPRDEASDLDADDDGDGDGEIETATETEAGTETESG
jgi:hypothetical protein